MTAFSFPKGLHWQPSLISSEHIDLHVTNRTCEQNYELINSLLLRAKSTYR